MRRRTWLASGWLAPVTWDGFSDAHLVALAVIGEDASRHYGRCGLTVEQIAASGGVSASTVTKARRWAIAWRLLDEEDHELCIRASEWTVWLMERVKHGPLIRPGSFRQKVLDKHAATLGADKAPSCSAASSDQFVQTANFGGSVFYANPLYTPHGLDQ